MKKRSRRMVAMLASATALFTGGWFVASNAEISLQLVSENFFLEMSSNYLARASLVLPRGGSRRPQVVITAAREGGLVNKA